MDMTTEDRIRQLLSQMTLAEKVSLLSGEDFWSLPAIERLGSH
jgi:beta-glucosidase